MPASHVRSLDSLIPSPWLDARGDKTIEIAYIAIGILVLMIAIFVVFKSRYNPNQGMREPEYRTFFIMGIAFVPIGIGAGNSVFWILGLVFLILGITNREKWKSL